MSFQQYDPITIQDVKDELDKKLASASLLDKVYPVGSIYMSTSSTSPADLFGGTWESLKDRFLVGAGSSYEANATGGASSHAHTTGEHTLTIDELPSHNHGNDGAHNHLGGTKRIHDSADGYYGSWSDAGSDTYTLVRHTGGSASYDLDYTSKSGGHAHSSRGGDGPHSHGDTGSASNIPPYLAVYMWKRIA